MSYAPFILLFISIFFCTKSEGGEGGRERLKIETLLGPEMAMSEASCHLDPKKSCAILKVHKHEIFFLTFFAETETLWSQGPVTRDF